MKEIIEEIALARPSYWGRQYSASKGDMPTHEWLGSFSDLETFFQDTLLTRDYDDLIFHLGSGDSIMPADLASLGYTRQVCIDFSATVVKVMSEQHRDIAGISWHQADLRDMGAVAEDKAVDVAFDKATLDAMIYGSGWNPPAEVKENTAKYLAEVHHLLEDDGIFICVSFPQPHFIRPLLTANGLWDTEVRY